MFIGPALARRSTSARAARKQQVFTGVFQSVDEHVGNVRGASVERVDIGAVAWGAMAVTDRLLDAQEAAAGLNGRWCVIRRDRGWQSFSASWRLRG